MKNLGEIKLNNPENPEYAEKIKLSTTDTTPLAPGFELDIAVMAVAIAHFLAS